MVSRPVVSSIRSRQTGQVGSSIREGVGGARGFVDREAETDWLADAALALWGFVVESGSLTVSGKSGSEPLFAV
jgi:hypothetical protein